MSVFSLFYALILAFCTVYGILFIQNERKTNIKRCRDFACLLTWQQMEASHCRQIKENSVFLEFHLHKAISRKMQCNKDFIENEKRFKVLRFKRTEIE